MKFYGAKIYFTARYIRKARSKTHFPIKRLAHPSQYIPQDMTKTDRILKFNAIFAAYEICNINLKVAICFIKF
ncbi:hypothetical protein, partial [uncultured Campylobacter sp.]|uniref:hypothetical protein n=1 Tax=uncultured Campylobacter sp. TaxID=218934 RepID=UPI0026387BE3